MKNSTDFKAVKILKFLTMISPLLVILGMCISFLTLGVLQFNYYSDLFESSLPSVGIFIALLICILTQVSRLSFGLLGAWDISKGNNYTGAIGILAGVLVAIFEHYECARMAEHFEKPELEYLLLFVNWISIGAEIRLLASMNKLESMGFFDDSPKQQNNQATKQQSNRNGVSDKEHEWLGNGNGGH
jgi:hypothetical protein